VWAEVPRIVRNITCEDFVSDVNERLLLKRFINRVPSFECLWPGSPQNKK
jgi:hypothetical protein